MDIELINSDDVISDMLNGFTRLEKDNLGFGSIQSKYGLNLKQVNVLFSRPALKWKRTKVPRNFPFKAMSVKDAVDRSFHFFQLTAKGKIRFNHSR